MKNDYTLEHFDAHDGNYEAYEAAWQVVHGYRYGVPKTNNPLWLKGESATGKTHLLYGIKNEIERRKEMHQDIMYMTDGPEGPYEQRTVQMISCDVLVRNLLEIFREYEPENRKSALFSRFSDVNVLMIEDVDYQLQGKESTQYEICNMIGKMVNSWGSQVIITSHELLEPFYGWLKERCPQLTVIQMEDASCCESRRDGEDSDCGIEEDEEDGGIEKENYSE